MSAEWAVVEIPGLLLRKDIDPWLCMGDDPENYSSWSWQFQVVDPDDANQWPECDSRITGILQSGLRSPKAYYAAKELIEPIQGQVFPTRREALQALGAVVAISDLEVGADR